MNEDVGALKRRVAELEARVEHLEFHVAELHELGKASEKLRSLPLHLTGQQQSILNALFKYNTVSKTFLYEWLYGVRPESEQPDPKIIDVQLCRLRAVLWRDTGVLIKTLYGQGYFIETVDKQSLLAGVIAPTQEPVPEAVLRQKIAA